MKVRPKDFSSEPAVRRVEPLLRLWMLRMLAPLGGHHSFIRSQGFQTDAVAQAIGLGAWLSAERGDFEEKQIRIELRGLHGKAEASHKRCKVPKTLAGNIERLSRLVGLNNADGRVLEFAALIHNERLLDDAADSLGYLSSTKVAHALSVILNLSDREVRAALSSQGLLARSGLLSLDPSGSSTMRAKLDLLSDSFGDRMFSEAQDPVVLLRDIVSAGRGPDLTLADFDHIEESLAVVRPYLRQSLDTGRKGVNVLIYGPPGTGKSQLVRVLARDAECELFEIASEDADGDPVAGEKRLRAFRAAQSFFGRRRALILFDETEDVFNDGEGLFGKLSTAQKRKAWMNRALEENPVPTLWLSNTVRCLDPAFVRRFDVVVELAVPPQQARERIVKAVCGDLVNEPTLARIAASNDVAPAVISRAAAVVRAIRGQVAAERISKAVENLVEATVMAQGHRPLASVDATRLPAHYDPRYINVDADLEAIAEGLTRSKSGRICLYGPPGTGKSAFGRWVADRLGTRLDLRRVSDIVSPFLGVTERNLARAFRESQRSGSVLLLDEVDSFLQDRRGARQSWEVTEVNEMLTQMEGFSGVFIATTNLMDDLDQAALRRFDLKLRFGYLKREQARWLFESHCRELGMGAPTEADCWLLAGLRQLTPGDFAAAARQHCFRPLANPADLAGALVRECELKDGAVKNVIGFR